MRRVGGWLAVAVWLGTGLWACARWPEADPPALWPKAPIDTGIPIASDSASGSAAPSSSVPIVKRSPDDTAHLFASDEPWYKDVSGLTPAPSSPQIISWLASHGGWGKGRFQIDFSFEILRADANTPRVSWTPTSDWYAPDCDSVDIPVPTVGAIEGEDGYACTRDGDCHLIVIHPASQSVYEMWRANRGANNQWQGGCLAVWSLNRVYSPQLRGEQCTSADAAGFPISALVFNADEVASGHIDHAIRFILPNDRIRHGEYVRPATHTTTPTTGGPDAPPYGVRFRLRQDYPLEKLPNEGARTVARALQKYGMLLADGGDIVLTAQSDRYTTRRWTGLLGSQDLKALNVRDFDVVDMGEPIPFAGQCTRLP